MGKGKSVTTKIVWLIFGAIVGAMISDITRPDECPRPRGKQLSYTAPVMTDYSERDLAFAKRMIRESR